MVDRADRRSPQIKIDGDFVTEQDGHADPDQFHQELFSADDLDAGLHTIELTNLEQKFVDVDYVSTHLHPRDEHPALYTVLLIVETDR